MKNKKQIVQEQLQHQHDIIKENEDVEELEQELQLIKKQKRYVRITEK